MNVHERETEMKTKRDADIQCQGEADFYSGHRVMSTGSERDERSRSRSALHLSSSIEWGVIVQSMHEVGEERETSPTQS